MNDDALRQRNRNRIALVAIFALFFGLFALAGVLRFSGWKPAGSQNKGEMLNPPGDLRQVRVTLADGTAYPWAPVERTWRVVVAPKPGCTTECVQLLDRLDLVWQLMGREADRVHILWLGEFPEGGKRDPALRIAADNAAVRAGLPRSDDPAGTPVYLVDPNGFVVLRYAPGFDPGHLRYDLAKLLKLK